MCMLDYFIFIWVSYKHYMSRFWAFFSSHWVYEFPRLPAVQLHQGTQAPVSCSPSTSSVEVGSVHWAHSKHASETSCAAGGWGWDTIFPKPKKTTLRFYHPGTVNPLFLFTEGIHRFEQLPTQIFQPFRWSKCLDSGQLFGPHTFLCCIRCKPGGISSGGCGYVWRCWFREKTTFGLVTAMRAHWVRDKISFTRMVFFGPENDQPSTAPLKPQFWPISISKLLKVPDLVSRPTNSHCGRT